MNSSSAWTTAVDRADIAVFAYRNQAARPIACAVTPYVDQGDVVVTSTLALPAKAVAARREGHAALVGGGVVVRGPVEVTVDRTSREFDRWVRDQELRKYPPARSLLAIPGHRRLLPWYVGRVLIRFVEPLVEAVEGDDRCTLTTLDSHGRPIVVPVDEPTGDPGSWTSAADGSGPACVLVHEETEAMAELRQLRVEGRVELGTFQAGRVVGSLSPQPTGLVADLTRLRQLARQAKRNRKLVDGLVEAGQAADGQASDAR